jgi:hypothetical protein
MSEFTNLAELINGANLEKNFMNKEFENKLRRIEENTIEVQQRHEKLKKELQTLIEFKRQAIPYLKDLEQIQSLLGNHSYASHLKLLLNK